MSIFVSFLKPVSSEASEVTPALFLLLFVWSVSPHPSHPTCLCLWRSRESVAGSKQQTTRVLLPCQSVSLRFRFSNPFMSTVIADKEGLSSVAVSSFLRALWLFVPCFLYSCLLLCLVGLFFCSEMLKLLSDFHLCIFSSYFLCGYPGEYI